MKTSLIISVYKNIADLQVVLEGLKFQTYKDFEIVISEDGEFAEMRTFLQSYEHPNKIVHLTQKDNGWRKNQALNNAIRNCAGDYLVFIDGDCILHERFIENHIRFSSEKHVVAGKRVKLGPNYSDYFRGNIRQLSLLQKMILKEARQVKTDGARFFEEAFYFSPDSFLGKLALFRSMKQLKGCNMSCFRQTIEMINGFDEDYVLPAIGEDIDLTWRFKGLGIRLFSVRNIAVQYHLYHKENWSDQSVNQQLMEHKMIQNEFVCKNGLIKRA